MDVRTANILRKVMICGESENQHVRVGLSESDWKSGMLQEILNLREFAESGSDDMKTKPYVVVCHKCYGDPYDFPWAKSEVIDRDLKITCMSKSKFTSFIGESKVNGYPIEDLYFAYVDHLFLPAEIHAQLIAGFLDFENLDYTPRYQDTELCAWFNFNHAKEVKSLKLYRSIQDGRLWISTDPSIKCDFQYGQIQDIEQIPCIQIYFQRLQELAENCSAFAQVHMVALASDEVNMVSSIYSNGNIDIHCHHGHGFDEEFGSGTKKVHDLESAMASINTGGLDGLNIEGAGVWRQHRNYRTLFETILIPNLRGIASKSRNSK